MWIVALPRKSSHENGILAFCQRLQRDLCGKGNHSVSTSEARNRNWIFVLIFSSFTVFSIRRPGDVEAGAVAAQNRAEAAHVSGWREVHHSCSLPVSTGRWCGWEFGSLQWLHRFVKKEKKKYWNVKKNWILPGELKAGTRTRRFSGVRGSAAAAPPPGLDLGGKILPSKHRSGLLTATRCCFFFF